MKALFRFAVYAGLSFAAWKLAGWWVVLLTVVLCAIVEVGVALWALADRAERRLGRRE